MMEKQIFIESPMKSFLRHIPFMIFLFIIVWAVSYFLTPNLPLPTTFLAGLFFLIFALMLLLNLFRKKKTITCDSIECQVQAKSIWEGFGKTIYHFNWSEVTETLFTGSENPGSFFTAVVNGQHIKLLNEESNSSKSFDNFVALVNQVTPHLPYIWTKDADNLEVIEKNGWFKKVPR